VFLWNIERAEEKIVSIEKRVGVIYFCFEAGVLR
jgi:hypothetical protein